MRLIVIPRDRLLALAAGCPGLLRALLVLEDQSDPCIYVRREGSSKGAPRWNVEVGSKRLALDVTNVSAMAAAVPIFLVDLVHDLQVELAPVFLVDGMMEGVARVVPFVRGLKRDEPS